MLALKICPEITGFLARQSRQGIILVSGTNGKTTTNNMLAQIMKKAGHRVVVNYEGANLITGVATALIKAADFKGKLEGDYSILEVDEAALPRVAQEVRPRMVVLTNFFRDQLDRYGEIDKTIAMLCNTLSKLPETSLILNADDPLVAQFEKKTGLPVVYYGLGKHEKVITTSSGVKEAKFCPLCGTKLTYAYYHYGQIGSYHCTGCGFTRPQPRVEGFQVKTDNKTANCFVCCPKGVVSLNLPVYGLYNLYNALAALTASLNLNISLTAIISALQNYIPVIGRMERYNFQGKPVFLNLVKNPAGFNEGLAALLETREKSDVFFAINDLDADGKDISWLWDVDFEKLADKEKYFNIFVCTGTRGEEMALRLKYANLPISKIKICPVQKRAVKEVLSGTGKTAFLLTTYTALWPTEKFLVKIAQKERIYEAERVPSVS
jgi:UDP-N-acetylmuramyl tripeptide synthase